MASARVTQALWPVFVKALPWCKRPSCLAFTRHSGPTGDRLFVRYIRPVIEASQRHADAPRLTDLQVEAMDAYDALIDDPDNQVEMALQPGDIQFVNNFTVVHGRTAYEDHADPALRRFLWRLWLQFGDEAPWGEESPEMRWAFARFGQLGRSVQEWQQAQAGAA